jgi:hypothetical protein
MIRNAKDLLQKLALTMSRIIMRKRCLIKIIEGEEYVAKLVKHVLVGIVKIVSIARI